MYELPYELPNNLRLRILGDRKLKENLKTEGRHSLVSSLPSRNDVLEIIVKKMQKQIPNVFVLG